MKWWKYIVAGLVAIWMVSPTAIREDDVKVGTITSIREIEDAEVPAKEATVRVETGEFTTQFYETETIYEVGDTVTIEVNEGVNQVSGFYRTPALKRLFGIFLIVVLLVTDAGGLRSLAGLAASFAIIFQFVLPQIAAGGQPLTIAVSASLGMLFISYYLTHGYTTKTTVALIGTAVSLIFIAGLAAMFGSLAKLTGFGAEEAVFLQSELGKPISVYNLLLAGMIIGALGVLDDITISQASVVAELKAANKNLSVRELFGRAMRVGHDHIASLVNTLVLVYTGSALPLLLLFVAGDNSWTSLLNYEPVAEEIVRTLVGSIGLVTAVPITTFIAAYWYGGKKVNP